jgi:hypothetical protein
LMECALSVPVVMNVLEIAPPFTYSYQCGSTLLISYIPVYMYSASLQLTLVLVRLFAIFALSSHPTPTFWMTLFPQICWPLSMRSTSSTAIRVIEPFQILYNTTSNLILMLSFGLCSPVLACSLMLNLTANLCSWQMLVGRFLTLRIPILSSSRLDSPRDALKDLEKPRESSEPHQHQDELVNLLREQVAGVHRHLIECKWPVICTSCFFMTMFSWEIVGDEVGWLEAIWVPVLGVVILFIVMVWDALLVRGVVGPSPSLVPATRGTSLQSSSHSIYEFNRPKSSTETF